MMWLANALTLLRIPLAAVFWRTYGDLPWSLGVVALAALTDAADGSVARWARARSHSPQAVRTSAGEWLDPLADKIFILVALGAVVAHEAVPWYVIVGVLARELVLVPLAIIYRVALVTRPHIEHAFQADSFGKATTISQITTIAALVLHLPWAPVLAIITGVLGLAAAVHYVARATHATVPS